METVLSVEQHTKLCGINMQRGGTEAQSEIVLSVSNATIQNISELRFFLVYCHLHHRRFTAKCS